MSALRSQDGERIAIQSFNWFIAWQHAVIYSTITLWFTVPYASGWRLVARTKAVAHTTQDPSIQSRKSWNDQSLTAQCQFKVSHTRKKSTYHKTKFRIWWINMSTLTHSLNLSLSLPRINSKGTPPCIKLTVPIRIGANSLNPAVEALQLNPHFPFQS